MVVRWQDGKFARTGDQPRQNRCIRLTDKCWHVLDEVAHDQDLSRADLLENLAESKFANCFRDSSDDKSEIIDQIKSVTKSLEAGKKPVINCTSKDKAAGRRILQALVTYLESSI